MPRIQRKTAELENNDFFKDFCILSRSHEEMSKNAIISLHFFCRIAFLFPLDLARAKFVQAILRYRNIKCCNSTFRATPFPERESRASSLVTFGRNVQYLISTFFINIHTYIFMYL